MTVRGVPELSHQPGPDPVGSPETYSEAEHKGQEAGEAGGPHPYLAVPDLSRLSPRHQLGSRLGTRYHSLLSVDLTEAAQVWRIKQFSSAPSPPLAPRRSH